ncbi:MAG: ATP-dependent helicase [Gammaproteobacteria bacterium]|nr:ATP-dependent helicase [Gammaproteobacteria bacterium]
MNFTDEQREAITYDGKNLQLIACAGSGKTEVVAQRIVHLLKQGPSRLAPGNIVAFTFTEKAADELKERIVARVQEELGDVVGLAEMFVGTIHAYCLELLKNEVPRYLRYEVLNEVQQALFVDRNSNKSGLTTSTLVDDPENKLKRYTDTRHYITALSILRESDLEQSELPQCSVYSDGLPKYQELLDSMSYFDYSSIMSEAVSVLENNVGVRSRLGERVKYVVVDEYQDINPVQERIIKELSKLGTGICVVGDDDQTIYQWRGGDVENILSFDTRYESVKQVALDKNFRSSEGVVNTAREFIEQNDDRLVKKMESAGMQTYEDGDIVALSFDSPDEEAEYIAQTIHSLRGTALEGEERGLSWSDVAILLRTVKGNATPITDALDRADIPYIVKGMADLFRAPEAEAARRLFLFMADDGCDRNAVVQSWMDSNIGIDQGDLEAALDDAEEIKDRVAISKKWEDGDIQKAFLAFLDRAGIREERMPQGRQEIVLYNLGKFSELISDFETVHYKSIPSEKFGSFAKFLVYGAENAYPEGWQDKSYATPDAVQIMTVHQAKGMQWPAVFLPALLKNRFPAKKVGGRNAWHLLPRAGVRKQERYEGTVEDERRLFYVALTRSKKFLHLTYGPISGNQLFRNPSDFWRFILRSKYVKRYTPDYSQRPRLKAEPRKGIVNVTFSFSDLKYFFECPYRFKLQILCGFNAPIAPALGYGKSLHDMLAEVHDHASRGRVLDESEAANLVDKHLHTPYASSQLSEDLKTAPNERNRASSQCLVPFAHHRPDSFPHSSTHVG